jgi:nucleotide-binding universal stress UspA family protein
MKILIGYNGSEAAKAALSNVALTGLNGGEELVMLTIAESWLSPKTTAEAECLAVEGKTILLTQYPDLNITTLTATGSPPHEMLRLADAIKADLIVVGEPRHEDSDRGMFLGQTTQKIINEARQSVRVARAPNLAAMAPQKLLVGFDGSSPAIGAVKMIASRHWPADTEVCLLAVADPTVVSSIGRFKPEMNDNSVSSKLIGQWTQTLADKSLKLLRTAGLRASIETRKGNPKFELVRFANEWHADTIFVGPHTAPNSFERFVIGSVSAAVAAGADCSVEVVRGADHRAELDLFWPAYAY